MNLANRVAPTLLRFELLRRERPHRHRTAVGQQGFDKLVAFGHALLEDVVHLVGEIHITRAELIIQEVPVPRKAVNIRLQEEDVVVVQGGQIVGPGACGRGIVQVHSVQVLTRQANGEIACNTTIVCFRLEGHGFRGRGFRFRGRGQRKHGYHQEELDQGTQHSVVRVL